MVPAGGNGKTAEEIAQAYRSPPWWYDLRGFFILTFAYNSTLWHQVGFFARNMAGPRHLEVACGTGTLLDLVCRWRAFRRMPSIHVTGVDYAEAMLAGAIRRFARRPGFAFQHADAAAMSFASGSFDSACIANSVHCFPVLDGALGEIFRVLRPGGTLAVNVLLHPRGDGSLARFARRINAWGMRKGILYTPYDADDIASRFVAVGFVVRSRNVVGNCLDLVLERPV